MNEITTGEQWAAELDRILRDGDHPDYDSVAGIDGRWNIGTMLSLAHRNGTIGGVAIGTAGDEDELVAADGTMAVRWDQQNGWFKAIDLNTAG